MNEPDLIKTVRGLDRTGPGPNGENLQLLWGCLAATLDGKFHAAEESSLRWLLKSMNGTSPNAETLRRYPLTWTILDCVFQRIPLFSLAKSLADRKFIAVMQQVLKEISKPAAEPGSPTSSKRKRSPTTSFVLVDLQGQSGCLDTARAVFGALRSLLSRIDDLEAGFSRDNIGAEHIKSLFCRPAAEATGIVAPALVTCSNLISSEVCGKTEGAEVWIETISTIWDLHLQGSDDTLEVAIHLFRPSAIILGKIGSFSSTHQDNVPESLRIRWSADLQSFMHRNFILPGRSAFINHQVFEPFTKALEISKSVIQLSGIALYFLSSTAFSRVDASELQKDNVQWIKQVFQAVEAVIRERPDRSTLMQTILEQAIQRSTPVDVEDLRRVCREYALQGATIDWDLVSKVATCDPDVFQLSDDGTDLRKDVCGRTVMRETSGSDYRTISKVIAAIMEGFRTRRGLPGFLRLWFEQLCEVERQSLDSYSPWFNVGQRSSPTESLDSLVEAELSPPQLLETIAWVETQNSRAYPHSICAFTSTIAQALRDQSFTDAVGIRLFRLVAPVSSSSGASALKWRVVSNTISWAVPDERLEVWNLTKDQLSKILQASPTSSGETFEAFKCCYQTWDYMSPDDAHADEPALLIETFTDRLATEIAASHIPVGDKLSCVEPDRKAELQEKSAYEQYLAWYLYGSSRFSRLYYGKKGGIPPPLLTALSSGASSVAERKIVWCALLRNEINLNESKIARDLVDRLIDALDYSEKEKGCPGEQSQVWLKMLASIPLEVYNRAQRERLMNVLSKQRAKMVKHPKRVSQHGWKLVLGITTKIMRRPTFYDGMSFSDLVEIATAMSSISIQSPKNETLLEFVQRFSLVASVTIRQMAEHIDERSIKYFQGASRFVSSCDVQAAAQQVAKQPFYMTLLKALTAELTRSPKCQGHEELGPLTQGSKHTLTKCIMDVIGNFVSDKELLASPSTTTDMSLFAAVDAAGAVDHFAGPLELKPSAVRKLEKRSRRFMQQGDLRGWKIQIFFRTYMPTNVEVPPPTSYDDQWSLSSQLHEPLLKELVTSITRNMDCTSRFRYLKELLDSFNKNCDTDGQILAIQTVVDQLIDSTDPQDHSEGFSLAAVHSQLTSSLLRNSIHATHICRILWTLLEKRPQAMTQWKIDVTLSTVCDLSSTTASQSTVPFTWLCKLVEVIIKKHRLRLEGHCHILMSTLQALLRNLIIKQLATKLGDEPSQEYKAHQYTRLITLVCEPTAGAVSRSQLHSALDSATDAAKRSAGRHMYLVLMQYVQLQLEESVPRAVSEALEPAINSIFDITPPEGRKILNDAMDGSGRAILRELFKRYAKFGKWSGV